MIKKGRTNTRSGRPRHNGISCPRGCDACISVMRLPFVAWASRPRISPQRWLSVLSLVAPAEAGAYIPDTPGFNFHPLCAALACLAVQSPIFPSLRPLCAPAQKCCAGRTGRIRLRLMACGFASSCAVTRRRARRLRNMRA